MSTTDARHVLAQAMGRDPPPVIPSIAEQFGMPALQQLVADPSIDNVQHALLDIHVWRSLALLVLLLIVPWIASSLYRARMRFIGVRSTTAPLDYKAQRKLARPPNI